MESSPVRRVLIVANHTSATSRLLKHITRLARERPCAFSLCIPARRKWDYDDWTLERVVPLLGHATGSSVGAVAGGLEAIREAVGDGKFDEIVISISETGLSEWLGRDLTRQLKVLGLPVAVIRPKRKRWAAWAYRPGHRVRLHA
jgi:hypothetical protein